MRARTDELARVMTLEGGKPLVENSRRGGLDRRGLRLLRRDGPQLRRPRDPADRVDPAGAGGEGADRRRGAASCPGTTRCCCWPGSSRRRSRPATRRGEAVGADAAVDADARRLLRRTAARAWSTWSPARATWARAIVDDERIDGVAFTGLGGDRQEGCRGVRRAGGADEPRDGRQGPVHRVRRRGRRRGGGRARRRLGRLPERRPGVHLGGALLRGARGLRRLRVGVRRLHELAARRAIRSTQRPTSGPMVSAPQRAKVEAQRRGGRGCRRRGAGRRRPRRASSAGTTSRPRS